MTNENTQEEQETKQKNIKKKEQLKKNIKTQKAKIEEEQKLSSSEKQVLKKEADRVEELYIGLLETPEMESSNLDKTYGTRAIECAGKVAQKILSEYADFSGAYPLLSEYGMSILNIGFQSIIAGAAGSIHAVKSEAAGFVINDAVGDQLSEGFRYAVDSSAKALQIEFPGLSYEDAASLVALSLLGGAVVTSGAGVVKQIFKKFDFKDMKKFDLHAHEGGGHGGHTLSKHGYKVNEEMLRIQRHKEMSQPDNPDLATSSFLADGEVAQNAVNKVMKARKADIDKWMKDPKGDITKEFDLEIGTVVGRGVAKDETSCSDWTKVRVVLIKEIGVSEPKIVTSYPVNKLKEGS